MFARVPVCSTNLGVSVRSANRIRPKNGIPMPAYIRIVFENTHTHSNGRLTTAASETEGVAAVSWIESLMIRRPLGSIDPNSIRETEHVCMYLVPASASLPIAGSALPPVGRATPLLW